TEERPFLHFNVCYYHSIEQCIERGIARFEPGAGGEHKRARGFAPTLTYSAHYLADRRLPRAVADFLGRGRGDDPEGVSGEEGGGGAARRGTAVREPRAAARGPRRRAGGGSRSRRARA